MQGPMLLRRIVLGAAVAAVLLAGAVTGATETQIILIGGGAEGSVQTQAARQICALVDEHAGKEYGCIARTAPGSVFIVRAIGIGLMEFGFAQSEGVHEAVAGSGAWEGESVAGLRAVFRLPPETAELVTGADIADDLVHDVVRAVFENLDVLRSAHPALNGLDATAMLEGLSAPLHPGAARYYQERGWLQVRQ